MVKCPNCGASHYEQGFSMTTAMYYPPIYKDGVNTNPDGNITSTTCRCLVCKHNFVIKEQYGEVIDIYDQGLKEEPKTIYEDISVSTGSGDKVMSADSLKIESTEIAQPDLMEMIANLNTRVTKLEWKIYEYLEKN